jgi:guanine nucleotide-binding protein subunit beta-2-like 1 protein
MTTNPLNLCQS